MQISTAAGDITINGTSNSSAAYSFYNVSAASKFYSTSGNITISGNRPIYMPSGSQIGYNTGVGTTGNITLQMDNWSGFGATVKGSGTLNLRPDTASTAISLGGSAAMNLATSWLSGSSIFQAGFSSINIGRSDGSGGLTVASALTTSDSLALLQGSGNIAINGALTITNGITNGKNLSLRTSGSATQTAAITNLYGLELLGTGGNYTLINAGNSFAKLAANTGTIKISDSRSLMIDEVGSTAGVTTSASAGWTEIATTGATSDLQVNALVVAGNNVALAAGRNYLNYYGSSALTAGAGSRWLVYSTSPAGDVFGAQDSTNSPVWSKTYAGYAPTSVAETGNRYLFSSASAPVAVVFSKIYDGLTTVTGGAMIDNAVFGTAVTVSGSGSTADKNAGIGKALTIGTLNLDSGAGYTLTGSTVTITPKVLTLQRTYNGLASVTTSAALTNVIGGDTVTLASGTGWMADKNAGSDKVFSTGTLILGGASAGNYTLASSRITIDKLALTLTGSRTYDGTTDAAASTLILSNKFGSDAVAFSGTGALASRNAGTQSINSMGTLAIAGADSGNYTLTGGSGSVVVSKASLIITAIPNSKTYDGLLTAAAAPVVSGTVFTGDTLASSEVYTTAGVGTGKTLNVNYTLNDGNSGNNYTVTTVANTNGQIFKAPLTITVAPTTGVTRQYDSTTTSISTANTAMYGYSTAGLVGGQTAGGIGLSQTGTMGFNGSTSTTIRNVGTYSPTLGSVAFSETSGNYAITTVYANSSNFQYTITKAPITLTGTRVYDGTNAANSSTLTVAGGKLGTDVITLGGNALVSDKNVGSGKLLSTLEGISLTGSDGGNYYVSGGTMSITKQSITRTAQANTKS